MSKTVIKALHMQSGNVDDIATLYNSYGAAPVIWENMTKLWITDTGRYLQDPDSLWALSKRVDIPRHQRAVLMMTYDNAIVYREHFAQAALDIHAFLADFPPVPKCVNHWTEIAKVFESNPDCEAIGFHMTSVEADPFYGKYNEKTEDHDELDWSKFWSVYVNN